LFATRYRAAFTDIAVRMQTMDRQRIDLQVVSPAPNYAYWADAELSPRIAAASNEHVAEVCATHPDRLLKFSSASDLLEAKRSGRLAIIYGFQDTTPLGEDLDRLDTFRALGLRIVQLTYNKRNLVGDGCLEPGNAGLSRFGNALVERMNATAMLIDLSHCGQRTTEEAIAASKRPVAITHSGCNAVYAHPRNKNDDTLRRLAARGGVIGIYHMPYLRSAGPPTSDDVIAHIEHALDVWFVGRGPGGGLGNADLQPLAGVHERRPDVHLAAVDGDRLGHDHRLGRDAGA